MQIPILAVSLFGGLAFGTTAYSWLGPMRLVASLHMQCFINSIAHMRTHRAPGEDSSQNIAWLGILHMFQGENWHGNHHAKPWSARLGWKVWQLDVGWYAIVLLTDPRTGCEGQASGFLIQRQTTGREAVGVPSHRNGRRARWLSGLRHRCHEVLRRSRI